MGTGDLFGQIYEYFLAEFARSEGSKGGEFFTPRSVVRLMVETIEPHGGKVFDPACGSGGMFVQSAHFIEEHRKELKDVASDVYVYGQEKAQETVNLAKMNLAVNGLRGDIKKRNSYYDDAFDRLVKVLTAAGKVFRYKYDAQNRMTDAWEGSDKVLNTYKSDRCVHQIWWHKGVARDFKFKYLMDDNGRIRETDVVGPNHRFAPCKIQCQWVYGARSLQRGPAEPNQC